MELEEWKSQIKRGVLEYCILLLIAQKDCYGYELMSALGKFPIVATKESTTYPLLRRLEKDFRLRSYWQDTAEGLPPRKYYAITPEGREYLAAMTREWGNLVNAIECMKGDHNG